MISLSLPEKQLENSLASTLASDGYNVIHQCVDDPTKFDDIRNCTTHDVFGIDIVAQRTGVLWVIEVKGETKGGTAAGHATFMAGIGQILSRITVVSENIFYSLAVPNTDVFAPSVRKFRNSPVLQLLNLSIILIEEDESFRLIN